MKTYALIILLLLHLISLLNGCCRVMQHEEVATENTDITAPAATENNDTTAPLVDEEKKFNGKYYLIDTSFGNLISVEVPYFDGDSAINAAISEYIKEYLFTLTDVQYNFNECAEDIGMENAYNNYFIDIDYQIKYGSEDILSIVFSGICNKLEAAHPIHLFFTFNYDRVTERRLVATDVFTIDENMYDVFLRYFHIKMREIAEEQWLSSVNIEDLFSKESFMVGMENESNWYLYYGTTSLGISCPVPHVMGDHIEIEIPYSELNSIADIYIPKVEIIEESAYYKITSNKFHYSYTIYDKNNNVVRFVDNIPRHPHIIMTEDNLICVIIQAGTGIETQAGYYYDIDKDVFSQIYHSIYNQYNDLVAYTLDNKIIIQDIFDDDGYYLEISQFESEFSDLAYSPFINVEFMNDGRSVCITYYSGDDYQKVSEVFELY